MTPDELVGMRVRRRREIALLRFWIEELERDIAEVERAVLWDGDRVVPSIGATDARQHPKR